MSSFPERFTAILCYSALTLYVESWTIAFWGFILVVLVLVLLTFAVFASYSYLFGLSLC